MTYFVISGSEDGGCDMDALTKEELLLRLKPDADGYSYYGKKKVLSEPPEEIDNFIDLLIIKGDIVVPKPKTVVKEWELP